MDGLFSMTRLADAEGIPSGGALRPITGATLRQWQGTTSIQPPGSTSSDAAAEEPPYDNCV
jgi:hypothetical protein